MSLLQRVVVSVTAALILAVLSADAVAEVDRNCLGCLCEASTGCNFTTQCQETYYGAYFCGPYHISWAYWDEAGRPVLPRDNPANLGAFEHCATDRYCSEKIVKQYMNKFGKDCDGDGVVSCRDYVRIHKLGKTSCAAPLPPGRFTAQFEECAARLAVF
ncbi:lysozyme 2-like isoform X6 [Eriocheir sinensis]|uniref:lysozyme 2-like isoform X6 n=1 Tax=Eriocheir sinensis TaxID=95602 RepID=UPI0021C56FB5|nr:lysozyme 2-like isoform X6 [Eriocheir sinensis]